MKPSSGFQFKAGLVFSYRFGGDSRRSLYSFKCPTVKPETTPTKKVVKRVKKKTSAKVSVQLAKQINVLKGRIKRPVTGRVSSRFGMRHHPIKKKPTFHQGIDIAAPKGRVINAAISGKVAFAGKKNGYGNLVIIKNGIYETRYAHCNTLKVKTGAQVKAGIQIATVGRTGMATGPHLHFETRINGNPINPEMFLVWE